MNEDVALTHIMGRNVLWDGFVWYCIGAQSAL